MLEQYCVFHKDQIITNFCRTPSCSMPLCPDCMNDHYSFHYNSKDRPQIENISQTYQEVLKIVRSLYSSFGDNYQNLKDYYVYRGNQKTLSQEVAEYKQKVINLLNSFFDSLAQEANVLQQRESQYLEQQLIIVEQFIKEKNNEIDNLARKIEGPKGLKYMVEILTSNFAQSSKYDSQKCNQFIKSLSEQKVSLIYNESKLYDLNIELAKLVQIENKIFFENFNQNPLLIEENKDYHPLGRFSDMRNPYQYSQNQSALMDKSSLLQIQQGNIAPVSIKNTQPISSVSQSYHSFPENQSFQIGNQSQIYKQQQQAQNNLQLSQQEQQPSHNQYKSQSMDQINQQQQNNNYPQVKSSFVYQNQENVGNQNNSYNTDKLNLSTNNLNFNYDKLNKDSNYNLILPVSEKRNDGILSSIDPVNLSQKNYIRPPY